MDKATRTIVDPGNQDEFDDLGDGSTYESFKERLSAPRR